MVSTLARAEVVTEIFSPFLQKPRAKSVVYRVNSRVPTSTPPALPAARRTGHRAQAASRRGKGKGGCIGWALPPLVGALWRGL
jgi:hypothetical protein